MFPYYSYMYFWVFILENYSYFICILHKCESLKLKQAISEHRICLPKHTPWQGQALSNKLLNKGKDEWVSSTLT